MLDDMQVLHKQGMVVEGRIRRLFNVYVLFVPEDGLDPFCFISGKESHIYHEGTRLL